MTRLHDVPVRALDPGRFASLLEPAEFTSLAELIDRGARELRGRAIWNVNSTAAGGGVAEVLRPLLGYTRGGGVDARWVVVSGTPEFDLTKRLHNQLHGFDGAPVAETQRELDWWHARRLIVVWLVDVAPRCATQFRSPGALHRSRSSRLTGHARGRDRRRGPARDRGLRRGPEDT